MKVILSMLDQTKSIIDRLESNVGGIELLGSRTASDLKKVMLSAGKVNKIIIFENALDIEDLDFLAEQPSIQVVLVMKTEEKMKQFDIKYFINDNITIVDFSNKSLNLLFIKNLIIAPVDKGLIYHNKVTLSNDIKQEDEVENTDNEIKLVRRVERVEEDDIPEPTNTPQKEKPKLESIFKPKREINIKKDEELTAPLKTYENPKDKLKSIIELFKNGCTIGVIGLPKSYSSTTTLNLARTTAQSDLTTLIMDTDFVNFPFSSLTDRLFKYYSEIQKDNPVLTVLRGNSILKNSFLYQINLHVLSNPIISDSIDMNDKKIAQLVDDLLTKVNEYYQVMFLDMRLEDIHKNSVYLKHCDKLIFNIPMTSHDLLYFMRHIETLEDDTIREKVFESSYIAVDLDNRKLLNSGLSELKSIDDFLAKNFNIINAEKYANIKRIGEITKSKEPTDYLIKEPKLDEDFYLNILLEMFGTNK